MIKSMLLGVTLAVGTMFGGMELMNDNEVVAAKQVVMDVVDVAEDGNKIIDMFYMYGNENGTYWLDPLSEYENVIYVGYEDLEEWNIKYDELHHGNKFVGSFTVDGWELLGLEYK